MKIFKTDSEYKWLELNDGLVRIPYNKYVASEDNKNVTLYWNATLVCSLWHKNAKKFLKEVANA